MKSMENDYKVIEDLSMIPYNYSFEQALRNNDIIFDQLRSYNVKRLHEFIKNIEHGISDNVRIAKFVYDGKATIAYLHFNGENILYTIDISRFNSDLKLITYSGSKLFSHTEYNKKKEYEVYYLITNTHEVVEVFIDA